MILFGVIGLLSEADSCPKRTVVRICVPKKADCCPKWTVVRTDSCPKIPTLLNYFWLCIMYMVRFHVLHDKGRVCIMKRMTKGDHVIRESYMLAVLQFKHVNKVGS